VDADDRVAFFSEGPNRVFARSRAIIGRSGAWLIGGDSGCGKSVLLARCDAGGFRLLSDDLVPFGIQARRALPMATMAPSRCGRHSSSAAAERVLRMVAASAGTRGSSSVQMTALAAGRRVRVMPSETMRASHSTGAPFCKAARAALVMPGVKRICAASPTMPAAWIMRTTTGSSSAAKRASSASARIMAKDCR